MSTNLNFRVSSALKDILGKDLITDDYIAVFELVKNAFDAHAKNVEITFENLKGPNTRIIIRDDGKGMNYDDLINKWLFVAYSAKKDGTEDENYDYRNIIKQSRSFAGAKGIGRFSCDRLGKTLLLETTKDEINTKTESLYTEWENFESNIKSEFIDISVIHESKSKSEFNIKHGTILIIENLRGEWKREKIIRLRDSLSKLIKPNDINESEENSRSFNIKINAVEELEADKNSKEDFNKVNGYIKNFIFETISLKTTKIESTISLDGENIISKIIDGGTLIYKAIEKNSSFNLLKGIKCTIYYLNKSAKITFSKKMGVSSHQYGDIFLYKNGFRVYPYGEPGVDLFKIDSRKAQGFSRFLGTRDIMGQIDIEINTDELKETSSRGDGLIKTPTYFELINFFFDTIKRLERYVVDVQQWGLSIEDDNNFDLKTRISDLIAKLTGSEEIIDFETNKDFISIIEASKHSSAETIIKNLGKIALQNKDDHLLKEVERASVKLKDLQAAKNEAEKQAIVEQIKAQEATAKLKEKISENLFLKSINSSDYEEVIALLHHIGIYAGTVDNNLKGISLRIQNDIQLSKDELNNIIRSISFETKKILNIVAFATKANFKLNTEDIELDLNDYIREYVQNIIPSVTDKSLNVKMNQLTHKKFIRTVKAIELNILIDNLINNAKKAFATEIYVILSESESGTLVLSFKDNGIGIEEEKLNRIYDFGYTTTNGSGLGLYHVKEIVNTMKSKIIALNNKNEKGVTFTIEFL